MSRRTATLTATLVALAVATCLMLILPVPYSTMKPGPAFNALGSIDDEPLLSFGEGVKTYPTDGELAFTTVSVSRAQADVNLVTALRAWFDPDVRLVPHDFLYRDGETDEDASQQGAEQLSSSQDASRAAALRAMGMEVPETVRVSEVVEDSPADGVLRDGDRITSVDGKRVQEGGQVAKLIGEVKPGDEVTLGIVRDSEASEVTVDTEPAEDDPKRARIGVSVGPGFDFPIEIENNIGDRVGGPSAGMMFALAIYDKLTPGALTGGLSIAGTGTISPDGVVGPVGGVDQKMAGAAESGATIFLVPAANCAEAAQADSDESMRLVKVESLEGAITTIKTLAEDPEAKAPACSK